MIKIDSKYTSIAAITLLFAIGGSVAVSARPLSDLQMTDARCSVLWSEAIAGSSGDLSLDMAKPYVNDAGRADTNGDSTLSKNEWVAACKQGLVRTSVGEGDGTDGSPARTSDRTPGDQSPSRTPNATSTGAAGTDLGRTSNGTSDRTPENH